MKEEVKEMGEVSARLTKISEGGRVWVTRRYPNCAVIRLPGFVEMRLYVNDRIETSEVTFAAFEFFTGGQIGVNKRTEVEIVGLNRAETLNLSFYDKYIRGKRQADPLQIRTSNGVTGLKG